MPWRVTFFLAQDESSGISLAFWIVVLLAVVIGGFFILKLVRKRLAPDEDVHGEGFQLSDLREMHKRGQLSEDEFNRAKAKMVESMHAAQMRRDAAKAEAAKQTRGMI